MLRYRSKFAFALAALASPLLSQVHISQVQADDVFANHVAMSPLPSGKGLAAAFPKDDGISSHEDVIFADNFESGKLGKGWDERTSEDKEALYLVSPEHELGGEHCMKVVARLNKNEGGGLTKWFEPSDTLFFRFYVKFDKECDYVHHFVTLRANKSLVGRDRWSGFGGAGNKPVGDERFSTALEPTGNWEAWPAPGKWNFYSYWHEMEQSRDRRYWGNAFMVPEQDLIPKDKWICAEFMIKHNTQGKPDGEQAFWIDGKLLGHWKGINWRTSERLMANALTLESYVTDRWTKNGVNIVYFDNVVIAKSYIGPAE
ncbi:hypothetical protein SH449x_004367 [Pirellulaceae bacterium SH449]